MGVIEVRGLRKEYRAARGRRTVALDGVDLDVPAGVVFGFLGPNGAGKSTTIRCLLGLTRPTAGRCTVLGVDPRVHYHRVQRRVGSLTENQGLFPSFSARRNLSHLARIYRLPRARVDAVLEQVGLAARGDDAVGTYSLGMRRRAGLAAALLKDPELLLLDEPANGLDPRGIVEVRHLLRSLADEGRTVFVSSHQLAEAGLVCDEVAVLVAGRCVAAGPVARVLAAAGGTGIRVLVDDPEPALAALGAAGMQARAEGDGSLRVELAPADAPLVAAALARHGVFPRELGPARASLEEAFLALTGTGER